jgi:hypothetical protein
MVKKHRQCRAFKDNDINLRLYILLLLFPPSLSFNIPSRPVIEIILAVLLNHLFITLRIFFANFLGKLADLSFVSIADNPVVILLKFCALLFKLNDLWIRREIYLYILRDHISGGSRITYKTHVSEQSEKIALLLLLQECILEVKVSDLVEIGVVKYRKLRIITHHLVTQQIRCIS